MMTIKKGDFVNFSFGFRGEEKNEIVKVIELSGNLAVIQQLNDKHGNRFPVHIDSLSREIKY